MLTPGPSNRDRPEAIGLAKQQLRAGVAASRRGRSDPDRDLARNAITAAVLSWCDQELAAGSRIAAYVALPTEPGSVGLLNALAGIGYDVIVPITRADRDLDWQLWVASDAALGLDAICTAALVLVPAFAVDGAGHRLGRGGGSYDRALTRVQQGAVTAALLFDEEVVDEVPVEPWDLAVTAIFSPSGLSWCRPD